MNSPTIPAPVTTVRAAMRMGSAVRRVIAMAALGGLSVVVVLTGARLDRAATAAARTEEPVYLPRAEYLRPMSLGWQNALADALWFRTISYFGEHYRSDRTYPWLAEMCDLVTDLDPRAEHVYRFCGAILSWEADQVDAGIRLLDKGAAQLPDSWLLQYHLGFLEYFFKDDQVQALAHLRRATELPGVHPEVAHLTALLAAEQYGPETTLAFLSELERNSDSQALRNVVGENKREMQAAANRRQLQVAVAAYQDRTGHAPLLVEDLADAGLLPAVPEDPFGGTYVIDPLASTVRSSTGREPARLHESPMRQRARRGESLRDL